MSYSKVIDWKAKQAKAKQMSIAELYYAIDDCNKSSRCGLDDGYYADEASVYLIELKKRQAAS